MKEFSCPECGSNLIEEICVNAEVTKTISGIDWEDEEDPIINFIYETDDTLVKTSENITFKCKECGMPIITAPGLLPLYLVVRNYGWFREKETVSLKF